SGLAILDPAAAVCAALSESALLPAGGDPPAPAAGPPPAEGDPDAPAADPPPPAGGPPAREAAGQPLPVNLTATSTITRTVTTDVTSQMRLPFRGRRGPGCRSPGGAKRMTPACPVKLPSYVK